MTYTTEDLVKAFLRAKDRGLAAEASFRARLDAAADRVKAGEDVEAAFFDLFGDDPEGRMNS